MSDVSAGLRWLKEELDAEDEQIASHAARARPKLKKQLPYVPWFHGDFLRSTVGWTLLEQAVYWKLLCAQWEIGPLPVAANRLASIAGIGIDEFVCIWQEVQKKFTRINANTVDERLINERMEAHREKYLEYRAGQAERGRKGMEIRWRGKKPETAGGGSNV